MTAERQEPGAADKEVPLLGGSMTAGVVRVGDTVRRPVGPWTSAVHTLLRYLEDVGFEGAPRALGIDQRGREVLTFLPSDPTPNWSDEALVETGRLVRRLHEALAGFVPPSDATWLFPSIGRRAKADTCIGHTDLCPVNTVYSDGVPYGFIDWDLAGPDQPLYDLAYAAISYTALRPDGFWPRPGCPQPPDRIRRLRLFCVRMAWRTAWLFSIPSKRLCRRSWPRTSSSEDKGSCRTRLFSSAARHACGA